MTIQSRPTPPSRLLLRHVSRDVIQQQLMLSWCRLERSRSLDHDGRRNVPVPPRHAGYGDSGAQQLPSQRPAAGAGSASHCSTRCRLQDGCSVELRAEPCEFDSNCWIPCDSRGDDVTSLDVTASQSQLVLDRQRPSTLAATARGTSSVCSAAAVGCDVGDWSADRRLYHPHPQRDHRQHQQPREAGSPGKKRLTLSCVMADVSGLLRCMRRLRVTRAVREHETCV